MENTNCSQVIFETSTETCALTLDATKAAITRDDDLARTVEQNDRLLDDLKMVIDEEVLTLLTKAPLATDLRLVTTAMKVSHHLERTGDEATTIARRAIKLNHEAPLQIHPDLLRMAAMAAEMLHQAMDHVINHSPDRAREIIRRDKEVDAMHKQVQRDLSGLMEQNPSNVGACLNLMVVSKSLERIADHASNIAEEVVYLYEARDIRHSAKGNQPPPAERS